MRLKGHDVTIFEGMSELGGMLRYGIPQYRLPKDILKKDIETIINTGIHVKTNTRVGSDVSFEEIRNNYDAEFLGIGAWKGAQLRIEGCDTAGVMDAIEFLQKVNSGEPPTIGHNLMVIGGGIVP